MSGRGPPIRVVDWWARCTIGLPKLQKAVACIVTDPLLACLPGGRGKVTYSPIIIACRSTSMHYAWKTQTQARLGVWTAHTSSRRASAISVPGKSPSETVQGPLISEEETWPDHVRACHLTCNSISSGIGMEQSGNNGCHSGTIESRGPPAGWSWYNCGYKCGKRGWVERWLGEE